LKSGAKANLTLLSRVMAFYAIYQSQKLCILGQKNNRKSYGVINQGQLILA
jgi:hypothetical protein